VNEPAKALQSLISQGQFDGTSLTPYLRGMAHAALGQMPPAIQDFQTVLAHRGSAMLLGGDVYPMAQLGLARAYAASRDRANSASAYRQFLMLWAEADRGQPLLVEALAKSK
jgi:serine/threonine-protein kinase